MTRFENGAGGDEGGDRDRGMEGTPDVTGDEKRAMLFGSPRSIHRHSQASRPDRRPVVDVDSPKRQKQRASEVKYSPLEEVDEADIGRARRELRRTPLPYSPRDTEDLPDLSERAERGTTSRDENYQSRHLGKEDRNPGRETVRSDRSASRPTVIESGAPPVPLENHPIIQKLQEIATSAQEEAREAKRGTRMLRSYYYRKPSANIFIHMYIYVCMYHVKSFRRFEI